MFFHRAPIWPCVSNRVTVLQSAPREHGRPGPTEVAGAVLRISAELAHRDHKGGIQQPALSEVCDQRGQWGIEFFAQLHRAPNRVLVNIPAVLTNFDEFDATLDQSAGQ